MTKRSGGKKVTKPVAAKGPKARIAKVIQEVLVRIGVPVNATADEVAKILEAKLGYLATLQQIEVALSGEQISPTFDGITEYLQEVDTVRADLAIADEQVRVLTGQLADARGLAKELQVLACIFQRRAEALKEQNTNKAALIRELADERRIFMEDGTEAEKLRARLSSVGSTSVPEGLDEPAPLVVVDMLAIGEVPDNAKPRPIGSVAALKRLSQRELGDMTGEDYDALAGFFYPGDLFPSFSGTTLRDMAQHICARRSPHGAPGAE